MSNRADTDEVKRPQGEKAPFQFGLRILLALPVAVAGFFAIAAWVGMGPAVLLLVLGGSGVGICFPPTRVYAVSLLGILILVALLLPAVESARPAAMRAQCMNNLRQIALALHNYHADHGCFPPAFIADSQGRPMHSWRVLVLPYMSEKALYDQYRFDEPWDGPNNSTLANAIPRAFQCPSDHRQVGKPGMTNYLAVVGPKAAWPGKRPRKLADFVDGTSETILLVEVHNSGILWTEPRDLDLARMAPGLNPKTGQGISSAHPSGALVGFADGSVQFLRDGVFPQSLRALLTIAGGEKTDDADLNR